MKKTISFLVILFTTYLSESKQQNEPSTVTSDISFRLTFAENLRYFVNVSFNLFWQLFLSVSRFSVFVTLHILAQFGLDRFSLL